MSARRYRPWDLMPARRGNVVYAAEKRDMGWPYIIDKVLPAGRARKNGLKVWNLALAKKNGARCNGVFREDGALHIIGTGKNPKWAQTAAKKNPGVFGGRGRGFAAARRSLTAAPAAPALFKSPATSSPSLVPVTGMSLGPAQTDRLQIPDRSTGSNYSPEMPQTVDTYEPKQTESQATLSVPVNEAPAIKVTTPEPKDWVQGGRKADVYQRVSLASAGGSATAGPYRKDLIDPQLWRLADGGDFPSMWELMRRGEKHWRPAFPNPRGLIDVEFERAEWGSEPDQYSLERRGQWYRRFDRNVRNIPGVGPGSRKNPSPQHQHDVEALLGEDGEEWARWDQDRAFVPRRFYRGIPGMGPARQNPPRRAAPAGAYKHFLKPKAKLWPIWRSDIGFEHARTVIQYMLMGRGKPNEYPRLLKKMASIISPSDPQWRGIWSFYTKNRNKIAAKAGREMPTIQRLEQRAKANARRNSGSRRKRRR